MQIDNQIVVISTFLLLLFLYYLIQSILEHFKIYVCHESGIILILAILFSFILNRNQQLSLEFNDKQLFYLLVPPIIFSAGYNMKKQKFFKNLGYISIYGILGTIMNFILISQILCYLNRWDQFSFYIENGQYSSNPIIFDSSELYLFSSLISSSDVLIPLLVIDKQKYHKLFSIIFGEGILNDAICIILFQCVNSVINEQHNDQFNIYVLLGRLCYVSLISILIGIIGGILPALFFKVLHRVKINPINETIFLLIFGLITYFCSQLIGVSGILAILISSILMNHYAFYNISPIAQQSSGVFFSIISYLAEAFIFIYLGICSSRIKQDISIDFTLYAILSVFLSRLITVLFLSLIFKLIYRLSHVEFILDLYEVSIILVSGVIRGAIAFGLVLNVQSTHSQIIRSSCFIMVLFTTIVLGSILRIIIRILQNLKISKYQRNQLNQRLLESDTDKSRIVNFYTPYSEKLMKYHNNDNIVHIMWKRIDNQYLKKIFVINFEKRQNIIKLIKNKFRQFQKDNKEMNKEHAIKFNSVNYGFISEFLLSGSLFQNKKDLLQTFKDILVQFEIVELEEVNYDKMEKTELSQKVSEESIEIKHELES